MQLYYVDKLTPDRATGSDVEARHLSKVMRQGVGDLAYITAGTGTLWQAEILQMSRSGVVFKPLRLIKEEVPQPKLALAVAPTKRASRIEDLLEKGVELGMTDLHLIHTERTLRKEFKLKRLEKLAVTAMKQCLRLTKVKIHEMISLDDFLKNALDDFDKKYIGKIEGDHPYLINQEVAADVLVAIGPEGDFTESEYVNASNAGFTPVKLSENRLRTETAGILAVASILDKRQMDKL